MIHSSWITPSAECPNPPLLINLSLFHTQLDPSNLVAREGLEASERSLLEGVMQGVDVWNKVWGWSQGADVIVWLIQL